MAIPSLSPVQIDVLSFLPWQMKLQGVHVDEEQTVSDPDLLAEVEMLAYLISQTVLMD